jgi:hypothetical protein
MIEKLKFKDIIKVPGKVLVGNDKKKGDFSCKAQEKIIIDKINEIIEKLNKEQ